MQTKLRAGALLPILLIAVLFRAWLIAEEGVSFESDEAVVGLMARHINQGEPVPTFFYGQDYMGSLDAILVAGGFRVFGESVESIRVVQAALYLLALVTGYALVRTITRSHRIAAMTLLLLAIPTALGALYTTITLGGYNEIVVLGNLVLLLGWQVTVERRKAVWRWVLLGAAGGIGWWCNAAIVTPVLVVGVMGLRYGAIRNWRGILCAAAGFMIGSAPWWAHNVQHDWAALAFLTDGFESAGTEALSPVESLIGLLLLGLPALYGLRYPWSAEFPAMVSVIAGAGVYLLVVTDLIAGIRRSRSRATKPVEWGEARSLPDSAPLIVRDAQARNWVWLVMGVFMTVFVLSSFADATGRYLLPVWIPAALGVALGLDRLRRAAWWLPALLLAALLVMQAATVIRAARSESRLTPQLVERLRIPTRDDAQLLEWLADHNYTRGYASYWTTFRLIFRSGEAVIFDTALPYDDRGFQPGDNRYPPYRALVTEADRVVWITQNFPELDTQVTDRLAAAGITYRVESIGVYRVYYDFSRRVAPGDVGLMGDIFNTGHAK